MAAAASPASACRAERVEVAGRRAPWLVMVHGASQDRRLFSAQVTAFQDRARLLLIDLAGHGASSALPGPYGLEEYAAGVLAAMEGAGIEAAHFWGSHTGAGVGLLLAARQPARFRSLVLEGAVLPGQTLPSVAAALARARATTRAQGLDAARREWFELGRWFDVIRRRPEACRAAAHWAMIADFGGGPWLDDTRPRPPTAIAGQLSSLRRPVLLVNGEHDVPEFLELADQLARALPDAEQARIEEAGGFPLWEFPDRINARVRRFLDRVG
jgi:pimeloyl-ACP methyl ester carboxylesterase